MEKPLEAPRTKKTFVRTARWLYNLVRRHHFEAIQTDETNINISINTVDIKCNPYIKHTLCFFQKKNNNNFRQEAYS